MKLFRVLLPTALVIAAGATCYTSWVAYTQSLWTRDAKVHVEIAEVAPKVSGEIVTVAVHDNQFVNAGDLLFAIDDADYKNSVSQAKYAMLKAEAELEQSKNSYRRDSRLLSKKLVSEEQVISEKLAVAANKAALEQAKSSLAKAELDLSRTKVVAPQDGYVTNLNQRQGNYINKGETFVALVESDTYYILAYFTETKVKDLVEGAKANIRPFSSDKTFVGKIEGIGRAIIDQSADNSGLISNVNPTVPWVRLAQRVPVRISIPKEVLESERLIAGTTVSVDIQ
ncbi:efflux RND transporter periplasmic adaptor subunit [Vibrio mediterranei]|uniref:HlyD family secretion protein n=1 Tax=Vibrio mediterranei TaxID=689 RepID=A0ABX5D5U3_9VIBR|nr:HlyD family secretion protein [Vibrio mediterranei]MCG9661095.1 HlyD family secretion protein [Vibrio mediterranei]MCG9663410.1 HlyD family secretion protein [Vibrio mediterranei]PCD85347.1 HlyD family secretion protein [Vibrio mediterranei]PRQ65039.1 HlyD family secretion protein [Vibrio mediterranei]PTC04736.1 HlyD family secretion protein [Vibrio mediterranei]